MTYPRPDIHAVVRKYNETAPTWRCVARGCGWNGRWRDALAHAVAHQWSDANVAPRPAAGPVRIGDVNA